ncbi:MAG TPA: lysophospholipid acyltransferase family protein [Rickettsiales bacterium]|nr:lysophospholipid acyltransferase family protein [Rickettsiales bacterium]
MVIRSAIFNAGFWILILVLGLCGLPFALVYPPAVFTVARLWGLGTLWMLKVLCGITYEVRGREHMPKGAAIIASKHQSAWDTVVYWILLERPAYVLKRELLFFPVFGWYLILLKNIYINRKAGASAMKHMLREAKRRAAEGRPIVIFPEGTRTAPGATAVYHPGVAAIYQNLGIPVVPVALNSGKFWSKNAFVKKPGVIVIEFLENITPGMKNRDFLAKLQNVIEDACQKL